MNGLDGGRVKVHSRVGCTSSSRLITPRPNLLNEPSTVFSFSDDGGRGIGQRIWESGVPLPLTLQMRPGNFRLKTGRSEHLTQDLLSI